MKRMAIFISIIFLMVASLPFAVYGEDWAQAVKPRSWRFPQDHGAHPGFRTEWWYFTGNLKDAAGGRYGYQLTFFRQGLRKDPPGHSGPWEVRDIYLAHFALTDAGRRQFHFLERVSRAGPGLAGARTNGLNVWLLNWSAVMEGGAISLFARDAQMEISLQLTPSKPVVLHGEKGRSRKGPQKGQASYYASITDLKTRGFLRLPSGMRVAVEGQSWFDHEFGSNQLSSLQEGWDWFGLHLSDGRDLMLYLLRLKDGSIEPASSGTLVEPGGGARHLRLQAMRVSSAGRWKSPRSGAEYPSRWLIQVPAAGIELQLAPLLPDQELDTAASTGITYWEGAVAGEGRSAGRKVSAEGYAELTGYAGKLGGIF